MEMPIFWIGVILSYCLYDYMCSNINHKVSISGFRGELIAHVRSGDNILMYPEIKKELSEGIQ